MDWILLSGFGTAALLLIELRDFISGRWPRRSGTRTKSLPVGESAPTGQSAPALAVWHPGHHFATQGPRWQTTARRLAGQWTVMDGVIFHHEAHVHGTAATTESAIRRTLSADQILSARINAAYAVWAAARSSEVYRER